MRYARLLGSSLLLVILCPSVTLAASDADLLTYTCSGGAIAAGVIGLGLAAIKTLHPRGMILAADWLEGEMVEDAKVGEEAHEVMNDQ